MRLCSFWRRLIAEWKIKAFLGGAITAAFWGGYFLLERSPKGSVTQMPELAIDRMIPFQPGAAFFYVSQFVTMPLVMWLMTSRRQLLLCCRGLAVLIGASFVLFYCWPTSVARPEITPGRYFIYDLIARTDLPRNACPSLHAAFGTFTAGCAWELFRSWKNSRWLIGAVWLWTAAVLLSTLLTKQHVVLDLVAGGVLGVMSWWFMASLSGGNTTRWKGDGSSPRPIETQACLELDGPETCGTGEKGAHLTGRTAPEGKRYET